MSDTLEINKVVQDPNTGEEYVINDLNFGKYTVVVNSGQSYDTKQQEEADQILELIKVLPKVGEVGSDLLVRSLDFKSSEVLGERLEKTIPPQFLTKEVREANEKDAPPPTPSPEQIQAQAEQEKQKIENEQKMMELAAKKEIEAMKVETAKINFEIKKLELAGKQEEEGRGERKEKREMKKEEHEGKQAVVQGVVDQLGKKEAK